MTADIWPSPAVPAWLTEHDAKRREVGELMRQAAVRRAVTLMLEMEQRRPAYQPGDAFEVTAWREGRRAALTDMLRQGEETNSR